MDTQQSAGSHEEQVYKQGLTASDQNCSTSPREDEPAAQYMINFDQSVRPVLLNTVEYHC